LKLPQLAPRPVTTVERQVGGMEEFGEPFRPRLFPSHGNSFLAKETIVNPDASVSPLTDPGPRVSFQRT
jgi:hypothetical protein